MCALSHDVSNGVGREIAENERERGETCGLHSRFRNTWALDERRVAHDMLFHGNTTASLLS